MLEGGLLLEVVHVVGSKKVDAARLRLLQRTIE